MPDNLRPQGAALPTPTTLQGAAEAGLHRGHGRPPGLASRMRGWLDQSLSGFPEPPVAVQGQRADVVGLAIREVGASSALPPACVQASSRFLSSLPSSAPVPATRRIGASQLEFHWQMVGRRHLSVIVGDDGMLLYRAGFGAEGRIEGAEPDAALPSPVLRYICERLFDPAGTTPAVAPGSKAGALSSLPGNPGAQDAAGTQEQSGRA